MTPQRFDEFVVDVLRDIKEILGAKNAEYARSTEDKLMNFKRRATQSGLDPMTVLQIDLFKHIDAINSYMIRYRNGAKVLLNDPINKRLNDSIIYMILLQALIEDLGLEDQLSEVGKKEHGSGIEVRTDDEVRYEIICEHKYTEAGIFKTCFRSESDYKIGGCKCGLGSVACPMAIRLRDR